MSRSKQADGTGSKPRFDATRRKWVILVSLNGKRKPIRADTEREVVLAAQTALVSVAQGMPLPSNKHTVHSYLRKWHADEVQDRRLSRGTLRGYLVNIEHICTSQAVPRGLRLGELEPSHIQALRREMLARGLSERTAGYIVATLSTALTTAVTLGLVPRNIVQSARRKSSKREMQEAEEHIQPLDDAQIEALRTAVAGERLEALFLMAVALGMRRGELLGLRWSYVNLVKREVRVHWQLAEVKDTDGTRRLDFESLKTRGSKRTVDLPDSLVDVLVAHRDRQAFERQLMLNLWQDRDLVFCTEFGGGIETTTLYRTWERIRTKAGFERRFHDLRHTAATQMLAQGTEMFVVSKILGHSNIQTTANTYGHVYHKTRRAVADRMNAIFGGQH